MRERTDLEERLGSLAKLDRELEDAIALVELGEEAGDDATEKEGRDALKALKADAERRQVEALLSGEVDPNDTYIEVHSGRRRHRELRLGAHAVSHVRALGRAAWLQGRDHRGDRGRWGRHQVRHDPGQGPQRARLVEGGIGRAPAGAHLAL